MYGLFLLIEAVANCAANAARAGEDCQVAQARQWRRPVLAGDRHSQHELRCRGLSTNRVEELADHPGV
jgi:hypothetical protein